MKQPKYGIRYQIVNNITGDNILHPFIEQCSAEYMSNEYFPDSMVIEIEIELC